MSQVFPYSTEKKKLFCVTGPLCVPHGIAAYVECFKSVLKFIQDVTLEGSCLKTTQLTQFQKLICEINVSVMKICLGDSRVPEVYTLVP